MSLDPSTRDLLSAARRGFEPTDEDRDRARAALSRKLGAGVFLAATTSAGSAGAVAATLGTKLAVVGALSTLVVGGALGLHVARAPSPASTAAPVGVVAPLASVHGSTTTVGSAPVAVSMPSASASTPSPSTSTPSASTPSPSTPSPSTPSPSTNQASPPKASTSGDDLDAELALLRRARAALAGSQFDVALALLDEHGTKFPYGTFAEERRGLSVIAQCKAGRPGAAGRARAFVADRPGSPLVSRVVEACGLEKDPP